MAESEYASGALGTFEPPKVLGGRYRLTRLLGGGGMGRVFEAEQLNLGRRVAVKVLKSDLVESSRQRSRFEREARSMARLNHPNIATLFDVGVEEGVPYLVLEYLDGQDLEAVMLKRGCLDVLEAATLVQQAALGVGHVHEQGLVHRDLKPSNLFIVSGIDTFGWCKVLDFGIAKGAASTTLTWEGSLLGTIGYMAPEQVRGDSELDGRCDVFALGAILYECLAGETAFKGDNRDALLYNILRTEPTDIAELRPEVTPALRRIVHRALCKAQDERFASGSDMAVALRQVIAELQGLPKPASPRLPETVPDVSEESPAYRVASGSGKQPRGPAPKPRRGVSLTLGALLVGGGTAAGALIGARLATVTPQLSESNTASTPMASVTLATAVSASLPQGRSHVADSPARASEEVSAAASALTLASPNSSRLTPTPAPDATLLRTVVSASSPSEAEGRGSTMRAAGVRDSFGGRSRSSVAPTAVPSVPPANSAAPATPDQRALKPNPYD